MSDIIDRLEALAALRRGAPLHDSSATEAAWLDEAISELARLRAEVEGLRADAERYRYLRNRTPADVLEGRGSDAGCWIDCEDDDSLELMLLTGDDADAAIDLARPQEGK